MVLVEMPFARRLPYYFCSLSPASLDSKGKTYPLAYDMYLVSCLRVKGAITLGNREITWASYEAS